MDRGCDVMESDILHETDNMYLCKVRNGLEVRLLSSCGSYSVNVGNPTQGVERAKLTMQRLETRIAALRKMYQCQ